ncbi:hypothetical protein [Flammeovirga sp. EKP202]|uniref:hypothetical protein n=1 Tax=Flammeovirga sp. EKP202 TaxID=2770592 RepID=UPI00165F031E|nr:hypothetical protein [Flammeovirga sp. EKP202]MBD0402562.1 hypothetical protein [Flammeovirga sp. EKP202]
MDNQIIEKRIDLGFRKKEVKSILNNLHKKQKNQKYIQLSSIASILIIFSFCTLYTIQLTNTKIVDEMDISFATRRLNHEKVNRLEYISISIQKSNYAQAKILLQDLESSDYKDWFQLEIAIGVNDLLEAQNIITKIESHPNHLFKENITIKLKLDIFLLSLKE